MSVRATVGGGAGGLSEAAMNDQILIESQREQIRRLQLLTQHYGGKEFLTGMPAIQSSMLPAQR